MFDIIDTIESMGTLEGINLRSDLYKAASMEIGLSALLSGSTACISPT